MGGPRSSRAAKPLGGCLALLCISLLPGASWLFAASSHRARQAVLAAAPNQGAPLRGAKTRQLVAAATDRPLEGERPPPAVPPTNPLGTPNRLWQWRGQQVRYQVLGEEENPSGPSVLLVHGLFVNADHWRRNLGVLADAGFKAYAVDLLGYGYTSKPFPTSAAAQAVNGELRRELGEPEADLGTSDGGRREKVPVPLRHPVGSAYNFYTWAEELCDFVDEVMKPAGPVTLVGNSIGSIASLQAAVDRPDLFGGLLVVNPNFRELHVAEQPGPLVPLTSAVQAALRSYGKPLYDALANPLAVKNILKEPYHDPAQVTDELVDVLLTPLLEEGAAEVVFDTLSYSAGPLPEQLLQDPRLQGKRVWVCWGERDPWTPSARVKALDRFGPVERVVPLPDVGHCPHDEAPHLVNPIIVEFVKKVAEPVS